MNAQFGRCLINKCWRLIPTYCTRLPTNSRSHYYCLTQKPNNYAYVFNYTTKVGAIRHFCTPSPSPVRRGDDDQQEPPNRNRQRSLPRLMNFPEILWPSSFKSIKNWIMVQFIIRPYFDPDFYIRDFIFGAKHAIEVISSKLVNGEFNSLNNMLTSDAIEELKPIIQKLSVSQRRQLEISKNDIYLTFPYQVGIIFDETNDKVQKRWVEITMVFHVLRGLTEMRERGDDIPWNLGVLPEYQDKVFVCNYRFIKEFTSGSQSDWTCNVVNHFKPIDLINES